MREAAKNGLRSGLVVIGALAFGYLSLQLGFKPYLEKAQLYNSDDNLNPQSDHQDQVTVTDIVLDDASPSQN
ncbi:hypothetical protein L1987_74304 [Smallanthus sonchifolius]|uniref:Uncharacterized protein n=1 Tax=Smallanthus sonchifolius TaxID=185202 RepID=A0ACB9A277_9ASTR|nr:hypothetical protein L1987_74304 [Smallanthus sonchifolius]